uniref:Protein kinase domain-containing protein n=1 Tax=Mycena chlorophos TaxID=658473 RepID=A0ABQ0L610_MYCCL|nr:predicted protein [Mycena chlorophos]
MAPKVKTCQCQWATPDDSRFGLHFEDEENVNPTQTLVAYLRQKIPGVDEEMNEGILFVLPLPKMNEVENVRQFKQKAHRYTKGALLITKFQSLPSKNLLFFERPSLQMVHLAPADHPPSTLAKLGDEFKQSMNSKATRIHGVVPLMPETSSFTRIVTVHGACHAEPFAQMYMRLKQFQACGDVAELKAMLLRIEGDENPRGLQFLLGHAKAYIKAQSWTHTDESAFRAAVDPHVSALLGHETYAELSHTNDSPGASRRGSARPDVITEGGRLVEEHKLTAGGDPAVQAVHGWRSAEAAEASRGKEAPTPIGMFLTIRPRVIEVGHILLAMYRVGTSREASWQAAVDHTISVGGASTTSNLLETLQVAGFFVCVGKALSALDTLLQSPRELPPIAESVFPNRAVTDFKIAVDKDDLGTLYSAQLLRTNDMRIFRATWSRREHGPRDVVVKVFERQDHGDSADFDPTAYGESAHATAARIGLAPTLIFFGDALPNTKTGWFVAVMDHVVSSNHITKQHIQALRAVPHILEQHGLIHGDLRLPNIVFTNDGTVQLVDWNWAGHTSRPPRYPHSLNMNLRWAPGVAPGTEIKPAHDMHQLFKLASALEQKMGEDTFLVAEHVRDMSATELYNNPRTTSSAQPLSPSSSSTLVSATTTPPPLSYRNHTAQDRVIQPLSQHLFPEKEQKRMKRVAGERIKVLKFNDEEAYMLWNVLIDRCEEYGEPFWAVNSHPSRALLASGGKDKIYVHKTDAAYPFCEPIRSRTSASISFLSSRSTSTPRHCLAVGLAHVPKVVLGRTIPTTYCSSKYHLILSGTPLQSALTELRSLLDQEVRRHYVLASSQQGPQEVVQHPRRAVRRPGRIARLLNPDPLHRVPIRASNGGRPVPDSRRHGAADPQEEIRGHKRFRQLHSYKNVKEIYSSFEDEAEAGAEPADASTAAPAAPVAAAAPIAVTVALLKAVHVPAALAKRR